VKFKRTFSAKKQSQNKLETIVSSLREIAKPDLKKLFSTGGKSF
jgi:hypothetical protein